MKTPPNIVSKFLENDGVFQKKPHDHSVLGQKALASAGYFNIDPRSLRKIDKHKAIYQTQAFAKMMKIIQPDLTTTEKIASRLSHFRPFEIISFIFNVVIFNNKALSIGYMGGTTISLGYLFYSQFHSDAPINWSLIPFSYVLCYIIGQLVAFVSYIANRSKST